MCISNCAWYTWPFQLDTRMRPVCVQLNCMRINKLLYLHGHVKSLSAWAVGIIKASRINCLDRQIIWRCKERGSDRLRERERGEGGGSGEEGEEKRGREWWGVIPTPTLAYMLFDNDSILYEILNSRCKISFNYNYAGYFTLLLYHISTI